MHARWEDPIYRNLTNLRVYKPHEKANLPQVLRILRSCPNLTDLDLYGCLQPLMCFSPSNAGEGASNGAAAPLDLGYHSVVSLPKLKYLSLQECHDETTMNLLGSLSLPQLKRFYMNNSYDLVGGGRMSQRHKPCFTDQLDIPFPSLLPTIAEPKLLRINAHFGYIFLDFQYVLNDSDRVRIGNWVHHGDNINAVQRPKLNHADGHKMTDEECGLWSYTLHPLPPGYIGSQSMNANDWMSVTYNIGLEPTPGASPPYPTNFTHAQGMLPRLIPVSQQYIDLFNTMSIGGVQFDMIHTLQLDGSAHFPDAFYRTIFGLCSGVRALWMNYYRCVGILAAIVKDDENMLPELENIYLDMHERNGRIQGANGAPAEVLANWVEIRQRKALTSPGARVRSLKTVFVQFYDMGHPEIAIETKERIKSALGENGLFVWRLKERFENRARKRQVKALKEDQPITNSDQVEGDDEQTEYDDERGIEDDEPDASGYERRPYGWSAGPR
jgi:hypothetical protein